jgi:hypothetical protein
LIALSALLLGVDGDRAFAALPRGEILGPCNGGWRGYFLSKVEYSVNTFAEIMAAAQFDPA